MVLLGFLILELMVEARGLMEVEEEEEVFLRVAKGAIIDRVRQRGK